MARLPPTPSDHLSGERREINDKYVDFAHKALGPSGEKFVYEQTSGALVGPFPFFTYHPQVGKQLIELQYAFAKLPIPPDVQEVAILTTAASYGDTFVGYSHEAIAIHTGRISSEQAKSLRFGQKPSELTKECDAAFDVARSLCADRGPLPGELWDRAVEVLGKDTTVALLHYIGFYSYVSIALNGIDASIPD